MRPSENLERMRSLLVRMEQAVDGARETRENNRVKLVNPAPATPTISGSVSATTPPATPISEAPPPILFSTVSTSGKPKARAKSLEEFEEAFKRLASRQAG